MTTKYLGDEIPLTIKTNKDLTGLEVCVAIDAKVCGVGYHYEINDPTISEYVINATITAEESINYKAGIYDVVIKTNGKVSAVAEKAFQLKEHCLKSKFVEEN